MAKHIHRCPSCNEYTLEENCPACHQKTLLPRPPKFSLQDKYADLKRKVKKEEWKEKGFF